MRSNRHVCWEMPQGLGKTLVGQLVILLRLQATRSFRPRGIIVTPTTILADQHAAMAAWFQNLGHSILHIDEALGGHPQIIRNNTRDAVLTIATPGLLAHRWAHLHPHFVRDLRTLIIDEIDTFVVRQQVDETPAADDFRYHKGIEPLLTQTGPLPVRILGMTGTPQSTTRGRSLLNVFGAQQLQSVSTDAEPYLPLVRLQSTLVDDDFVSATDIVIAIAVRETVHRIAAELNRQDRDFADITDLEALILFCSVATIGSWCTRWIKGGLLVTASLKSSCVRYKSLQTVRLALFDDSFDLSRPIATLISKLDIAISPRGRPWPSGKYIALRNIITGSSGKRQTLIFCRYISQVERYVNMFHNDGLSAAMAHGSMSPFSARESVQAFRTGRVRALAMTRDFGCRGLDFPFANSLVLCSPLSDVSRVDQEVCRIRPMRKNPKVASILAYANSAEDEKLNRLCQELATIYSGTGQRYVEVRG